MRRQVRLNVEGREPTFGEPLYQALVKNRMRQWEIAELVFGQRHRQPALSNLISGKTRTMRRADYDRLLSLFPELEGIEPVGGVRDGHRNGRAPSGRGARGNSTSKTLYAPRYEDAEVAA